MSGGCQTWRFAAQRTRGVRREARQVDGTEAVYLERSGYRPVVPSSVDNALAYQGGEFLHRHAEELAEHILVVLTQQRRVLDDLGWRC